MTRDDEKPLIDQETSHQKFERLMAKRKLKVRDEIRKIGNLSNRSIYSYTDDVLQHLGDLSDALREVERKFQVGLKKASLGSGKDRERGTSPMRDTVEIDGETYRRSGVSKITHIREFPQDD